MICWQRFNHSTPEVESNKDSLELCYYSNESHVMATWLMGGTNAHSITNASKFWAGEYWVKNLAGWLEFYIQKIWDICFWVTALEL